MVSFRRLFSTLVACACLVTVCLAVPVSASAGSVSIIRDTFGVPHVYGSDLASTFYGVGYATAQDRLWQAEILRRLGTGTSAEIFGPGDLAGDISARAVLGPKSRRAAMIAQFKPETRTILEAYAAGFNAWIAEARAAGKLPIEFTAFGFTPRPWTVDDSMAVFMAAIGNFGEFGADELDNLTDLEVLAARLGPVGGGLAFADTHWLNDPSAPTSVPAGGTFNPPPANVSEIRFEAPPGLPQAAAQYRRAMRALERNFERRAGLRREPASNAIAIGPGLSATGRPILLGGPQLGYTVPQASHEMGIHGGGFNVTGMAFAGIPGVLIGSAPRHSWTLTSGGSDNRDIYLEALNPANPLQYQFAGGLRNLDCRVETIPVRGAAPVNQVLCESVHGPVLATVPGAAITLRRAARGVELVSYEAVLAAQRAKGLQKFADALSMATYNFNVLYADTRGNIAYFHVGRIPIRASGDNPFLPHPGIGIAEWQGFIPWAQMPRVANPAQGWLTSWNNKPAATWNNSTRGFYGWGPVHRVNTLNNVIRNLPAGSVTTATVERLNLIGGWTTDTPSGNASVVVASSLLGDMLGAVDAGADPRLPAILGLLANWDLLQLDLDNSGRYDDPEVAIFNLWYAKIVERVFAGPLGSAAQPNTVANLLGRMLRPGQGLPLRFNYLGTDSASVAVTQSLIAALDELTTRFGSTDPAAWQQRAAKIRWRQIGAAPVPDTPWMNRGTYNQITHLGPQPTAINVVAPGQSGNPFNPHFADQLGLYATWRYKPMRLKRGDLTGNIESVTRLTPVLPARQAKTAGPAAGPDGEPEGEVGPRAPAEKPELELPAVRRRMVGFRDGKALMVGPRERLGAQREIRVPGPPPATLEPGDLPAVEEAGRGRLEMLPRRPGF